MLFLAASLAVGIYVVYDILAHGFLFTLFFGLAHGLFYSNPRLANVFGIKFGRTDEFSTNRDDSQILVSQMVLQMLGIDYTFGSRDHITQLKMKQRQQSRPIDLAPYFVDHVDKRMSVAELETLLIDAWVNELADVYEIPLDKAGYASKVKVIRKFFPTFLDSAPQGIYYAISNIKEFLRARSYLTKLERAESLIMVAPFLTTVDSSIFNFVTNPDPIKEFHNLFENIPVEYVPIKSKGRLMLIKVVANKANNPGNSVFGPQGLICPGNTITSNLLKSVAQLKEQYCVKVEGKVKQKEGIIRYVTNPEEVFVTFSQREVAWVSTAIES